MSYKRKKSPFWWTSFTDANGKRVRRSLGTTNRKEAEALEAKWKGEAFQQQAWDVEPDHTFEELMLGYLNASASDKRSAKTDRQRTKSLKRFFAGKVVNDIRPTDIRGYIMYRREDGVANTTINRELSLLSAAIKYSKQELEWDILNPVEGRRLGESEGRLRWLTREEANALIEAAKVLPRDGHPAFHLADFIVLALHTGCRSGELLGLEWDRVDLRNNLIRLEAKHTKSGKGRSVPINGSARAVLLNRARHRAEHCPDSPWVFVHSNPHWKGQRIHSVKKAFAAACKRAQLEDCTPHTLRHTCASWMVMAGRPLMEVRDILGHSTVKMTERYAHLAPENLRNAVNVLEDRSHFGHTGLCGVKTDGSGRVVSS